MKQIDVYREYGRLVENTSDLWRNSEDMNAMAVEGAYLSGAWNMLCMVIEFMEKEEAKEKPEEKAQESKEKPNKAKDKPKKSNPRKTDLDIGKVKALRNAGWTMAKIADEMGVTPGTICNRLKAEAAEDEASQTN